jgi:hypothetical protein
VAILSPRRSLRRTLAAGGRHDPRAAVHARQPVRQDDPGHPLYIRIIRPIFHDHKSATTREKKLGAACSSPQRAGDGTGQRRGGTTGWPPTPAWHPHLTDCEWYGRIREGSVAVGDSRAMESRRAQLRGRGGATGLRSPGLEEPRRPWLGIAGSGADRLRARSHRAGTPGDPPHEAAAGINPVIPMPPGSHSPQ